MKNETVQSSANDMPYVPTADDMELTSAAEKQMDTDPLARIRPITQAVWSTLLELAPQLPKYMMNRYLTEAEVFKFLECLERHGYTIAPMEVRA